jgi:hypothetical protein
MGMSTEFTNADILCGKDKTYSKHEGNMRFRRLIQDYVQPYQSATTKQQKMTITKEIVTQLETEYSARFLKMVDIHSGEWQEISTQNARDKTSHALRFAAGKSARRPSAASSISYSAKMVVKSSYSNSNCSSHTRNVSVDASFNANQYHSSGNSSVSSVGSHSSSSSSSAHDNDEEQVSGLEEGGGSGAVHQSLLDRQQALFSSPYDEEVILEQGPAAVKELFDRQQAILIQMRKDLDDAEVQAITERTASAHVTTTTKPAPRELEEEFKRGDGEFNTLRSEDLHDLLDDPLVEGEWDNVMDLTKSYMDLTR